MSRLGGLNKAPDGIVIGLVQIQNSVVVTPADLARQTDRNLPACRECAQEHADHGPRRLPGVRAARAVDGYQSRHRVPPRWARGRQVPQSVRDYPEHTSLWSMAVMKIGNSHLRSYNGLLRRYAGAGGLKTGFTCDSGFNIIGSATRDGHKLIAVALGATTDGERSQRAANGWA
jgi:hypothetical protein